MELARSRPVPGVVYTTAVLCLGAWAALAAVGSELGWKLSVGLVSSGRDGVEWGLPSLAVVVPWWLGLLSLPGCLVALGRWRAGRGAPRWVRVSLWSALGASVVASMVSMAVFSVPGLVGLGSSAYLLRVLKDEAGHPVRWVPAKVAAVVLAIVGLLWLPS